MTRRVAALAVLSSVAVLAQARDSRPAFEVASIKINAACSGSRGTHQDKAQVVFTNMPLSRLLMRAYQIYSFQLNGPRWMDDVCFDIAAKYPEDAKESDRPLMLRTLLEEQLKLTAHRETRQLQGYVIVVARGGFKLKPVDAGQSVSNVSGGFRKSTLAAKRMSIAALADLLTRIRDEMVIDKTGLTGVYDFDLNWSNDDQNPAGGETDRFPPISSALAETLGLRLQSEKVPVQMVVVDHVERTPSDNR